MADETKDVVTDEGAVRSKRADQAQIGATPEPRVESDHPSMPRITVKSASYGRVGAHEVHPEHPGGEAWVDGYNDAEVAATPYIVRRLQEGNLVQVDGEPVFSGGSDADVAGREWAKVKATRQADLDAQVRRAEEASDLDHAASWHESMATGAMGPEEHLDEAKKLRETAAARREGK